MTSPRPGAGDHVRTMVQAGHYEIRLRGPVAWEGLDGFEDFESDVRPVETILRGTLRDQEVHRVLERIGALGLELVAVRRLPGQG
jgi:hypothetical protein